MPYSAPLPVLTIIAVGVAKPSAQGQAITITAVKAINEKAKVAPSTKYHTTNVASAITITAGTNQADMRSANACTGALDPCASSINLMICANIVSPPTLVASSSKLPFLFIVEPMTLSPECFSTGRLSPVIIASSTADEPVVITPSTGTISPGRTITLSPTAT